MPVLDAHAHIFPEKIARKAVQSIACFYGEAFDASGTSDGLLESGARAGIDRFLVHSTATKAEQVGPINDYIAAGLLGLS